MWYFVDYEDDLPAGSHSTRIVTADFPLYFAAVSRVRLDVAVIGCDGGVISSKVVPQCQAVFPSAALSKPTKVALQVLFLVRVLFEFIGDYVALVVVLWSPALSASASSSLSLSASVTALR